MVQTRAQRVGGHLTILKERLLAEEPTPARALAKRVSLSGERVRQIEGELRTAIRDDLEPRHQIAA